jgi:hypothetical protein
MPLVKMTRAVWELIGKEAGWRKTAAWGWSHTPDAYENARTNMRDWTTDQLHEIYREWIMKDKGKHVLDYDPGRKAPYPDIKLPTTADGTPLADDLIADYIWERAEKQALCDDGGAEAWVCPFGCHTVPFELNIQSSATGRIKTALDNSDMDPLWDAPDMDADDAYRLINGIEQERIRVERSKNPLNDRSKESARRYANKVIHDTLEARHKTFYNDQGWEGIHQIFNALDQAGIEWELKGAEYQHDEHGNPARKVWNFVLFYLDKKNKRQELYGTAIGSLAGTVADPWSQYDVISYVS